MNQYPWSILIEIYQYHDQYQDRKQPNIKYTIYETSKIFTSDQYRINMRPPLLPECLPQLRSAYDVDVHDIGWASKKAFSENLLPGFERSHGVQ